MPPHCKEWLRRGTIECSRPAFCLAVAGITALSVGACTAVFSIVIAVLFPRWPYADPERLAIIWHSQGKARGVVCKSRLLATAGGLGGVLLAKGLVTATVALRAGAFPRLEHTSVDLPSLAVALACMLFAGVLSGIAPALRSRAAVAATLVAGRALTLLVPGVLAGAAVAAGLSRYVESLLFGIEANDPATIALVTLLLLAVASAAATIPAIRAARLDPLTCLRHD